MSLYSLIIIIIITIIIICKNKFCENPSYGSRIVPSGQTGGQTEVRTERCDEADSQFSQLCESACPGIPY
jgi:hypothetical protein